MAEYVVPVTVTMLTPLGEPETGWCGPCALPSLLTWHVAFEASGRILNDALTAVSVCTDCGTEQWT